ncbi:CPBP family intramembrane glutamic endopeptidase [Clostridium neuense]|uniref:CPBP family intramembrane glutamic endopeptidase n=1 Tax=Clostridium neuense TaxID=1728934 RepID=A0ABW8TAP7_9CLOT
MIKGYIKNHEIISFIFLTFLFSWIIWGILYCSSIDIVNNVIYKSHMSIFICLGAFAPSSMSIILTGFLYKKKGLKALLTRLTKWRYNLIYYLIAVFYWIASLYISYLICKFFGSKGEITFTNVKTYYILEGFMITLLLGGPLGEEIGWRGFLLPRLQKKLNPFYSSIVLGIIWSCWHLPLFFIAGTDQYGVPFLLFIMTTIINTIIITWIFNRTNGSLIFPILFHTCNNIAAGLLAGSYNFAIANIYKFSIVQIIIMIFVVRDMFKQSKFDIIYK